MIDKWSEETHELMAELAQSIEDHRLAAGEKVSVYCARLSISEATYGRLIKGNPGVALGALLEWIILTGKEDQLAQIFQIDSLFDIPVNKAGQRKKRVRK